jgi:lysophospholipid acyltransferase (LPLAT)-like uncharacterized protein
VWDSFIIAIPFGQYKLILVGSIVKCDALAYHTARTADVIHAPIPTHAEGAVMGGWKIEIPLRKILDVD